MNVSLRKIYTALFFIGLFFIPFNSFMGIKELGEFKKESGAYFLILGFLFLLLEWAMSKKISFPYKNKIFLVVMIFMAWCIATIVLNFPEVAANYFKKTTGINRFVRQYFVLVASAILFFALYWNVMYRMSATDLLMKVRKVFLYSFTVVTIYGFFEIAFVVFGFHPAYAVLRLFDYFPFTEYDVDAMGRISSVCFESPALGTFLITVAGWMFSYMITNKGFLKYVPTLIVVILTYFSGSRTALIVVFLQLIVFLSIYLTRQQKLLSGLYILGTVIIFAMGVVVFKGDKIVHDIQKKTESLDFKGNLKKSISNQSRFGIQYANLIVFAQNPIIGVGYGQQAYEAKTYYPAWAKKDNYEFKLIYLNKNDPMFPPGYNLYIRLLAETGIIGCGIFIFMLYTLIKKTRQIIKQRTAASQTLAIILLVTFVGFIMNWMQTDSFRMYGFWLSLAILIKLNMNLNIELNEKK